MTSKDHLRVVPITIETVATGGEPMVHIGDDEPLSAALHRVAIDQLSVGIANLSHIETRPDGRIHETRTGLKRVRALLRLVRDEIGHEVYRNENVVLRDVGRRLAPVRDSHVLILSLDTITDHYGNALNPRAFAQTRSHLRKDHRRKLEEVTHDRQLLTDLVMALRMARSRFTGRPILVEANRVSPIRDDFAAIRPGMRRVYRRGRRAGLRSMDDPSVAQLHEWRKRVKYLRYQNEFLAPMWPDLLDAQAERLRELGEILGNEHDLSVLRSTIVDDPLACVDAGTRELLVAIIDDRRSALRREAFSMWPSLYREKSAPYLNRMEGYWRTWRGVG